MFRWHKHRDRSKMTKRLRQDKYMFQKLPKLLRRDRRMFQKLLTT
jgi:G:T-mismatch repair DNA endonuclease (very short patch repair protein)